MPVRWNSTYLILENYLDYDTTITCCYNMKLAETSKAKALTSDDWYVKTYTYRYPVISHLARDVLVIHVSTVSSEQAFSTSGHIIEPRRSCLSLEMVEVLTCIRDWEYAKKRLQNQNVDNEHILNFNNIYVDEPSSSGQC
ncbi:hypothetical protein Ddye_008887 [Dipteronia dyeriana]|uniref:HAT C-terminal dimerisation domain-containing protein n=1 Tax=Dipteronia dyeriana TaxID=168575 RepID=A0AAD9XAK9_9ROSI|nr:hypothetical protein Ddye_008887 [Dipteronia dyeriana]